MNRSTLKASAFVLALLVGCASERELATSPAAGAAADAPSGGVEAPAAVVDASPAGHDATVDETPQPDADARATDATAPTPDGSAADAAVDPPPKQCPTPCAGAPVCSGGGVRTCRDHDGDGCIEWGIETICPKACYDGMCVQCATRNDCADPVRQTCDSASRTCKPDDQWSVTTITYDSGLERDLDDCSFCDATPFPASNQASLRFQQSGGHTLWALNLAGPFAPGTYAIGNAAQGAATYVYLGENDKAAPSALRGAYMSTGGTITFTQVSLVPGGVVQGTLTATLTGGNDVSPRTATLTASFYAQFPP